uniref:Protein lifeguard 4-like protein n=1 Tax=Triatoma infestans TaxID=30076 RepID=A0A170YYS6_TRIIF
MASVPLMEDIEMGEDKAMGIEGDFAYRNNVHQASTRIRLGFLRKVYSLLFIQLLLTTIIGFIMMSFPQCKLFVHNNDWLVLLAFMLSLITLVALHIKRKESPTNFILLAIFTVVQAYAVGVTVTFFDKMVVLQALIITVVIVGGLTAFTFQTNRDFSSLGAVLFAGLCLLIIGGLIQIFIRNTAFEIFISAGGALVFSLFIIYDTQNLMKRVSPEEYILATIELYLDIINLFIYILRILDAMRK